ncbi:alpha/beta hydrolase [Aquibium carbonis]|uniref:Alpha/beta hydrolase n=2 Tax=Aquibium carbonis TaxID=2495581 RepID=A0A3S0AAL9_9HYPH|nr:alpha/beta hydrolase [Aquibium carbonis]
MRAIPALTILLAVLTPPNALARDDAVRPLVVAALEGKGEQATLSKSAEFAFEVVRPEKPNGQTMVLLHGSGGNETSLVKLASRIAPHATLLGIRGRVTQDGRTRWYKRLDPVTFDQDDVRAESQAFASFLGRTALELDIDLSRTVFLGYSNGANLIAATALLHPGLVRKAALLRPMSVLDRPPTPALAGASLLMIAGETDSTYAPFAPALEELLESCGAAVDARIIPSDHMIGEEDARIVAEWLATPAGD